MNRIISAIPVAAIVLGLCSWAPAAEMLPRADQRFAVSTTAEVPSLQRHVLPLLGRLGCSGRACHGSFQGQGGFRLSLFGYDFKMDHEGLAEGKEPRVDLKNPRNSLILTKATATDKDDHEGGHRLDVDSWQYRLLVRWIEAGAPAVDMDKDAQFDRIEVTPTEVVFRKPGDTAQLKVIAHWSNGVAEDVTPLCRFQTNDDAVAKVNEAGQIKILGPGDTNIVAFYDNGVVPTPVLLPVSDAVGPKYPSVPTPTKVDELVVAKLRKLGMVPSDLCTDAEFLRRVSLDITGTLPTAQEVTKFLADKSSEKRSHKINELLERPEYAAWWATKLCDLTGNNERSMPEQEFRSQYYEQWYRWLLRRVRDNVSYDKIVEGIVLATGRQSDQSYEQYAAELTSYLRKDKPVDFAERDDMPHYWSRRTVRTSNEKALSFSYTFLGVRLQCAECHKHPFDQWSQEDFKHFTAFFDRVRFGLSSEDKTAAQKMMASYGMEKLKGNEQRKAEAKLVSEGKPVPLGEVYVTDQTKRDGKKDDKDKQRIESTRVITPKVLGGDEVLLTKYNDPRQPLMDWLRQEDNPYFARAIVNRVWSNYFNVGIVEPPDDMNLANAPSNRELLDYLAAAFIRHGYDLKWLHREITSSRAYQASWKPTPTNKLDRRNFSHAIPRRMPAEVAYDAFIQVVAGGRETALRTDDPSAVRAIGLQRGYTVGVGGGKAGKSYALQVFGKPARETTCDCERSNEPSLLQTIYLRNDEEVLGLLDRRDSWVGEAIAAAAGSAGATASKAVYEVKTAAKDDPAAIARKSLTRRIGDLEQQLRKATKKKDKKRVDEITAEIKLAQRKLAGTPVPKDPPAEASQLPKGRLPAEAEDRLIAAAYLRSLSRPATDAELALAHKYMAESESTAIGLRDLLWALINTKEFVVNH